VNLFAMRRTHTNNSEPP